MTEPTARPQSTLQAQIVQLALALAPQREQQAQQAPRGTVLAACEGLLRDRGRPFLRDALAATLQHQAPQAEKKGASRAPGPADTPAGPKVSAGVSFSPR